MVKKDLFIPIPSFFKCPISLDVMKSPVSLSTGVTYDRSSIQKWLDNGNNTCPATMQILQSKDFVPNHTLQRLIKVWSESARIRQDSDTLTQEQAKKLLHDIENRMPGSYDHLTKLADFAKDSDKNKEFLLNSRCVAVIAGLLVSVVEIRVSGEAVRVLDLLLRDSRHREAIKPVVNLDLVKSLTLILQIGSLESRIESARVLETIAFNADTKILIAEKEGVLSELLRLVSNETDDKAIDAGLSCLISLSVPRRIRSQIVRMGSVPVLGKLLEQSDSGEIVEKVLKLLETVSTCTEGRVAICEDPTVITAIVQKMLKVRNKGTEHAVVILWSVCHVFRDAKAQEAVNQSNGLTKILLLVQSNCSPAVRQMSVDLLKIFKVNAKSCLSSYDTKTKHIMPF